MARYIELVGVPGVGKTSTYKFLKHLRTDNDSWKLFEDIITQPLPQKGGFSGRLIMLLKKLMGIHSSTTVKVPLDNSVLDEFMAQNEELIEVFWKVTMTKNQDIYGKDLRFHAVYYMMMIFKNLQAIKDQDTNKCFILDEGLILNLNYFINETFNEPEDTQLSQILDKIFMPSGIVLFECDLDTVINRTKTRGKLKPRDQNLSDEMLRTSREETAQEKEKFVDAVKDRGVPVLRLDAQDSIKSKALKIAEFAEGIGNK